MTISDPFDPLSYLLHIGLGSIALLSATVALAVIKGSSKHILSGRVFVVGAFIAALTAAIFSLTRMSEMALASSVMTFSALGSALLALKTPSTAVRAAEIFAASLMGLALVWMLIGIVMSGGTRFAIVIGAYAMLPLIMFVGDIRFLRMDSAQRLQTRLPRHFSRMAFAFAVAVHAPIVSFGNDLGLHPIVAFFAPLLLWPLIFFIFQRRYDSGTLVIAPPSSERLG